MTAIDLSKLSCLNKDCKLYDKSNKGNVRHHSFFTTSQGRQRRFICKDCGKTFSLNKGTPYYRLKKSKRQFDTVAHSSVEGTSKSAIARINGLSVSTVCRWLELAAIAAKYFNDKRLKGYELNEVQSDELKTFVGNKNKDNWVFTSMEAPSRLWLSFVVGNRSSANTSLLFEPLLENGLLNGNRILFMNDGFQFYRPCISKAFGPLAICAQVIKKIRKNRIVKVAEELVIGHPSQLEQLLERSLCSSRINTSFIERLNLTIRQGSSYLGRRTTCFSREITCFQGHLHLLQCYYNFVKYHRSLKCGPFHFTPAMEAGIANQRINFRQIFLFGIFLSSILVGKLIVGVSSELNERKTHKNRGKRIGDFASFNCKSVEFGLAA